MHIETNIKTPDLANSICTILRYDRKSGKFTYDVNFVLFPGNLLMYIIKPNNEL